VVAEFGGVTLLATYKTFSNRQKINKTEQTALFSSCYFNIYDVCVLLQPMEQIFGYLFEHIIEI